MLFFSAKETWSEVCQNNKTKNIERTQNLAFCSTVRSMLEDSYHCANETHNRT